MKVFLAVLLSVGIISAAYAGGFMLLHVGSSDGNGGGGGSNCILADAGNELLADTGNCILVQ